MSRGFPNVVIEWINDEWHEITFQPKYKSELTVSIGATLEDLQALAHQIQRYVDWHLQRGEDDGEGPTQ